MQGYSQCFAMLLGLPYVVGAITFAVRGARTEPPIAVMLNLLLPGLGYAYLGRWIRFLLVAGPILLLIASNLAFELRAVVEPVRLIIARTLSFGTSSVFPVLVVLVWLAQAVDAGRVARRGQMLQRSQSRAGQSLGDDPSHEPPQDHT